jgi:small subunit ribosomal protein S20
VREAVEAGDQAAAETALKNVNKSFHSYAGKGILTKNTAARRVSRLAQLVNTLGSVAA